MSTTGGTTPSSNFLSRFNPIGAISRLPPLSQALFFTTFLLTLSAFILRSCIAPRDIAPIWASTGIHIQFDNSVAIPWIELQLAGIYWRLWTVVTMAFQERGIFSLGFSLWFIAFFCPRLEQKWGARDLGLFIVVVQSVCSCFLLFAMLSSYVLSNDPKYYTYWNTYHGSSALKLALLVADAQERPGVSLLNANSEVSGGSLKITMKTLPLIYLIFPAFALPMFSHDLGVLLPFAGFYISWFYLRFVKIDSETGLRGDRGSQWAWAEWFSFNDTMHMGATFIGNKTYSFFRKLKLLPSWDGQTVLPTSVDEPRRPTTSSPTGPWQGKGNVLGSGPPRPAEPAVIPPQVDEKSAPL